MKIIALFPVKNEDWVLPITIPQLKLFADEILCMDGGSTDTTKEYLASQGVLVRDQDQTNLNYSSWRNELLAWGRERGGTHFVWLDADEALTTVFTKTFKDRLQSMKPGQKLVLQWLCLWKNSHNYRDDNSVWGNLYKDFIFCDDGVSGFENITLHESRTPGSNEEEKLIRINKEEGAVLHFQMAAFTRSQIKQVFQRCREYTMKTGSARRINNKYSETLDSPSAKVNEIPDTWLAGLQGIDTINDTDMSWYNTAILAYFEKNGIEYYEPLQIWHIQKYHDLFVQKTGRKPKVELYPSCLVTLNAIKNKIIHR